MSDLIKELILEADAFKMGGQKHVRQLRGKSAVSKAQNTPSQLRIEYIMGKNAQGDEIIIGKNIFDSKNNPITIDELIELFIVFCGYLDQNKNEVPGIAFPPPIDQKGRFLGILQHEVDGFKKCWENLETGVMYKWARGYGKTYLATWFMEFTMFYFGFPWMYLSSTEILSDVAYWIFKWATKEKLIIKSNMKGGKKNTYTSFELSTGGRMRIYEYMGEEMVGQHGWHIAMDDIVKKKWQDRPTDGVKAVNQWLWSINYIRRKGLLVFGTRKYQGDLLESLEKFLVPKGLIIDILVPYIMDGVFPDWTPIIDPVTGRQLLSVPELYTWEELETKKTTVDPDDPDIDPTLAWESEMMQNPMPKTGGLAEPEDIHYRKGIPSFKIARCVGIGVDLAWGEGTTSDNSAVESCVMYPESVEKQGYSRPVIERRFCFLKSTIGRFPIRNRMKGGRIEKFGILETIQQHWDYINRYYPSTPKIIAIERNGGGIVIIDQARRDMQTFPFARNIIEDSSPAYKKRKAKDPNITVRLGITHSKEKVPRIFGELSHPIKTGIIWFLESLFGTSLIDQITSFPRGKFKDGPDAAGMIKDELNRRWSSFDTNQIGQLLKEHYAKGKKRRFQEKWIKQNLRPWEVKQGIGGRR